MAISFVAASTDGTDAAQGASATIPAGVQTGDRLLAVLSTNSVSGYTHVTPAGWTLLRTSHGSSDGGSQFASLFTKIAQAGDGGSGAVFEVTPSGSKDALVIAGWRGSDTTPLIHASSVRPHSGTATTTITSDQISVSDTPSHLVALASKKGGSVEITFTAPTDFTTRGVHWIGGGGAQASAIASRAYTATGATTVGTWSTNTSSAAATAFLVALTEGDPPALEPPVFRRYTIGGWFPAP